MYGIEKTDKFSNWLNTLRDMRAKASIIRRVDRFRVGNFGDVKPIANNLFEMRIDVGVGYRVYYTLRKDTLMLLLCGGDKSSQNRDIQTAKKLAKEY